MQYTGPLDIGVSTGELTLCVVIGEKKIPWKMES